MRLNPMGAAILAALPLTACGGIDTMDLPLPVHSRSHIQRDSRNLILFTAGETARGEAAAVNGALRALYGTDAEGLAAAETAIAAACRRERMETRAEARGGPRAAFAPAALALPLAGALIDAGAAALQRQMERWASSYEATWSARHVGEFYLRPPEGGIETAELRNHCFALIRREAGPSGSPLFVHVGRFVPSTDRVAIRIEPVLHAHTGTKARVGSGGSFNAAMTITVQGVWIDQRQNVTATRDSVFATTLDFGTTNLNTATTRIYDSAGERLAATGGWLPFVPISLREGRVIGAGPVTITATVAETAAARDLAAAMAKGGSDLVQQIAQGVREELAQNR